MLTAFEGLLDRNKYEKLAKSILVQRCVNMFTGDQFSVDNKYETVYKLLDDPSLLWQIHSMASLDLVMKVIEVPLRVQSGNKAHKISKVREYIPFKITINGVDFEPFELSVNRSYNLEHLYALASYRRHVLIDGSGATLQRTPALVNLERLLGGELKHL
jgi:hypothetical protein